MMNADSEFFHDNGYVVVPEAVPPGNLEVVIGAVWEFLEMDPEDSTTWYPPDRRGSIVHLHQHQSLWDNRQHPRVYQAFADILGSETLWVSMDRAGMKPPMDPRYPHYQDPGFVHWDLDISQPLPERLGVQGVLALTDTTAEMGGFQCIPGFHRVLADWIAEQPADRNPHSPDLSRLPEGFAVTPIPMRAGDLLIWNRTLAHGNGRNTGTRPRLAQYITMYPARDDEAQRQERIDCWRERRAPSYWERDIPEKKAGSARIRPRSWRRWGGSCWGWSYGSRLASAPPGYGGSGTSSGDAESSVFRGVWFAVAPPVTRRKAPCCTAASMLFVSAV